jgi:hypothetical protein
MKLRNNKDTTDVWPVVKNTMGQCQTWEEIMLKIKGLLFGLSGGDLLHHRTAFIKSCYVMLNNKKFCRNLEYQRVLTILILKLDDPIHPPKFAKKLFHKLRRLTPEVIARQRWGILRASMKFLSLHSRAVITANHPSRIDFTIKDD